MTQISQKHIIALRIFHGIISLYFTACLVYLFVVGFTGTVNNTLFIIALLSLAAEGLAVFVLNKGDCPLIHLQRRIGDNKPFFELLLPPKLAKQAIPIFAGLTFIALLILLLRFVPN